jgi:sugar O-acyltransferase (sialic acid O-acetyltransferase NeuD family)
MMGASNTPLGRQACCERQVVIVGSGGHAAVVADALLAAGATILGFTHANASDQRNMICGLPILGGEGILDRFRHAELFLVNGIGGIDGIPTRRLVQERLTEQGWQFTGVRHPSAVVSPFAVVGAGAQLFAQCAVQVGAVIGEGSIINTAAVVEHHVHLGAFVHIAPRAVLCGEVNIGTGSHIGAGAVIRQGLRLGERVIVGAGAVVVKDFVGPGTLVGVPARPLESTQ